MASGMLAMSTDVGGQRELITNETGVLLTDYRSYSQMLNHTMSSLEEVLKHPKRYADVKAVGTRLVRSKYTTNKFGDCVIRNLEIVQRRKEKANLTSREHWEDAKVIQKRVDEVSDHVLDGVAVERFHGLYNRGRVERSIEGFMTIGIKTYVCDETIIRQVENLVHSIRVHYPRIRIILANDGPMSLGNEQFLKEDPFTEEHVLTADSGISYGRNHMVNATVSRYILLLDDDYLFGDTTNLMALLNGIHKEDYDLVGVRLRTVVEDDVVILQQVGNITSFKEQELTLCVWNENLGPEVEDITHPFAVDVMHNAFIASVDDLRKHGWRNDLKVHERIAFFIDAKNANLKVGYFPSVSVYHKAQERFTCRSRAFDVFDYSTLPYKERVRFDTKCGESFPGWIRQNVVQHEVMG